MLHVDKIRKIQDNRKQRRQELLAVLAQKCRLIMVGKTNRTRKEKAVQFEGCIERNKANSNAVNDELLCVYSVNDECRHVTDAYCQLL